MSWPKADRERHLRMWFGEQVLLLCRRYEASEISGYRTEKRNEDVGGKPKSLHRRGLARNVIFDRMADKQLVMDHGAAELGLHWHDSHPGGRSLHLQALPAR